MNILNISLSKSKFSPFKYCLLIGLVTGCIVSCGEKSKSDTEQTFVAGVLRERAIVLNELPSCPVGETAEERAFWIFIKTLDTLPEKPSELAIAYYASRGDAPTFKFISMPEKSVLEDQEQLSEHLQLFLKRHPWLMRFIEDDQLGISSQEIAFTSYEELKSRCWKELGDLSSKKNELAYRQCFIKYLFIVDYLAARGSEQDKTIALELTRTTFSTIFFADDTIQTGEDCLAVQATEHIYFPLANSSNKTITELDLRYLSSMFRLAPSRLAHVNFMKWLIRGKFESISAAQYERARTLAIIQTNNLFIDAGLYEYAVYWIHTCHQQIQLNAPYDAVVKSNFIHKMKRNDRYETYKILVTKAQ